MAEETYLFIILLFIGLFGINNAIFKGLPKENRLMLGLLGAGALTIGIFGLFIF